MYAAGYAEEWIDAPVGSGKHSFWLQVVGDSMTAPTGQSIPEGALILVDPDVQAENGSLVVAKIGDSVTFKKLVRDAGKAFLKPLNPSYPVTELTGDHQIVGVVKLAQIRL